MNITEYVALANFIVDQVNYYCTAYILTVGALLNLITAVVFTRKVFWSTNMGFFYLTLSLVNMLGLITGFLLRFFASLNNDLSTKADISCKLFSFFRKYFPHVSSWIQVLITFERVACVSLHSSKLAFMKKRRNIQIMMAAIFVLVLVVNVENFLFYLSVTRTNTTVLIGNQSQSVVVITASCKSASLVGVISNFVSAIVRTLIPFPIMLVLNVMISATLINSKKNLAKNTNKSLKKEYQFAFTVVGMNVIFFILYFPLAVGHLGNAILQIIPPVSLMLSTTINLVYNVASNVAYVYMALNFFLNFFFNNLFRRELSVMLHLQRASQGSTLENTKSKSMSVVKNN